MFEKHPIENQLQQEEPLLDLSEKRRERISIQTFKTKSSCEQSFDEV